MDHPIGNVASIARVDEFARIMAALDTTALPSLLVAFLRNTVDFEHAPIFGYPPGRRPVFLFDGFSDSQKHSLIAPYLQGTYLVDPFFKACQDSLEPGLYRMRDLAPDEFYAQVGAHPGYVSPCVSDEPGYLAEEIGFFARNAHGAYIVVSLMRPHDASPFSEYELDRLREIEPLVQTAMARHWQGLGGNPAKPAAPGCLSDYVEHTLETFGERALTKREQEVAQMILRGHSSESLALQLGISVATAKIHRRNLYAKLGVSSQSELFALFLDVLSGAPVSDPA